MLRLGGVSTSVLTFGRKLIVREKPSRSRAPLPELVDEIVI